MILSFQWRSSVFKMGGGEVVQVELFLKFKRLEIAIGGERTIQTFLIGALVKLTPKMNRHSYDHQF